MKIYDFYCSKCQEEVTDVPIYDEEDKTRVMCGKCGNKMSVKIGKMSFKGGFKGSHNNEYKGQGDD